MWTLFDLWARIVERYTAAKLAYRSDTLPAISGIAKRLRDVFPEINYLAGVWKSRDMRAQVAHLAWACVQPLLRPKTYRAPSWSWASTDAGIVFDFVKKPEGRYFSVKDQYDEIKMEAEIEQLQTIYHEGQDNTSDASSGLLVVKGSLKKVLVTHLASVPRFDFRRERLELDLLPDEPFDDTLEKTKVFLLPFYSYINWDADDDYPSSRWIETYVFLMLKPASIVPRRYTRAGLGRISKSYDGVSDSNLVFGLPGLDTGRADRIKII